VITFGKNQYGQLGHSHDRDPRVVLPREIEGMPHSVSIQIACGDDSTYILSMQGEVYSCGRGSQGRLGIGRNENQHRALPVRGPLEGNPVCHIASGRAHCFAVSVSGRVYAWGNNEHNALGIDSGDKAFIASPQLVPMTSLVVYVACGSSHSAFLTYNGRLFTCGYGPYGQLGHGEDVQSVPIPTEVRSLGDSPVAQVECGAEHTCVLLDSGDVSSFGHIDKEKVFNPIRIGSTAVFRLIAGGSSTFAMRLDNVSPEKRVLEKKRVGINAEQLKKFSKSSKGSSKLKGMLFDMYSLNASFMLSNSTRELTDSSSMLDIDGMIESHELYVSAVNDNNESRRMRGNIAALIGKLDKAAPYVTEPDQLRVYLILLVSPVMKLSPMEHEALIMSIYRLPEGSRELLFDWIQNDVSPTVFKENLVAPLVSHLDKHIEFQKWSGQAVTLCNMLSRLHDMIKGEVSVTHFYTHALEKGSPEMLLRLLKRWSAATRNERTVAGATDIPEFSLFKFPFLLSANTKRRFLKVEDLAIQNDAFITGLRQGDTQPYLSLEVSRDQLLEDTVHELLHFFVDDLKKPLKVAFKGEEGVDAGGVSKEFFQLLSAELFNPDFGLFKELGKTRNLWFNPTGTAKFGIEGLSPIDEYRVVGTVIGLAIYNDTLLDVSFPFAMYQILLNVFPEELTIEDFERFDPDTAKQMTYILELADKDELEDLDLYFDVTKEIKGVYEQIPLCDGGMTKQVTMKNKAEYVNMYIRFQMYESCKDVISAMLEGFGSVVSKNLASLKLFLPDELELVLVGTPELDFRVLEENAKYEGGYDPEHKTVKRFWKIVHSMSYEEKRTLLKFITGVSRAPVGGMKTLPFKLQRAGPDSNQLPTSYTCFNTMLLPDYSSAEKMKKLILLAIENCEGFGLQ